MEVQQLKAALAENGRQLRTAQQRLARHNAALAAGGLTPLSVKKVLAIYALSAWQLDVAVQVAKQLSRLPAQHPQSPDHALVRKLFVDIELDSLLSMYDEGNSCWQPAMNFARKIVAELAVCRWVAVQNVVHGVAPSAAQVHDQFERNCVAATLVQPSSKRSRNKWVARWRRRWRLRKGKLRDADLVDPATLRTKAGQVGGFCGSIFGTHGRDRK